MPGEHETYSSKGDTESDSRVLLAGLGKWLEEDRELRETCLAVKNSMRRILSEYSFQREEGLCLLFKVVRDLLGKGVEWQRNPLGGNDKTEEATVSERVLRTIFPKTPPPCVQHPMCKATYTEKKLAMASLEGLCALSRTEQLAFLEARGVPTVLEEFNRHKEGMAGGGTGDTEVSFDPQESVALLSACLDTLLMCSLDCPAAQHQIIDVGITSCVAELLKQTDTDSDLKFKILEFLSVFMKICELPSEASTATPYHPTRGPIPPQDTRTPAQRLRAVLKPILSADIFSKLPTCVTLRTPSAISHHHALGSKRPTTRERDLCAQAQIISQLAGGEKQQIQSG